MHLKISAKWRPFYFGLNVLTISVIEQVRIPDIHKRCTRPPKIANWAHSEYNMGYPRIVVFVIRTQVFNILLGIQKALYHSAHLCHYAINMGGIFMIYYQNRVWR